MTPTASARNQPIGTDIQMPVTPILSMDDNVYASSTRIPSDITVRTTETPGLLTARKYP